MMKKLERVCMKDGKLCEASWSRTVVRFVSASRDVGGRDPALGRGADATCATTRQRKKERVIHILTRTGSLVINIAESSVSHDQVPLQARPHRERCWGGRERESGIIRAWSHQPLLVGAFFPIHMTCARRPPSLGGQNSTIS